MAQARPQRLVNLTLLGHFAVAPVVLLGFVLAEVIKPTTVYPPTSFGEELLKPVAVLFFVWALPSTILCLLSHKISAPKNPYSLTSCLLIAGCIRMLWISFLAGKLGGVWTGEFDFLFALLLGPWGASAGIAGGGWMWYFSHRERTQATSQNLSLGGRGLWVSFGLCIPLLVYTIVLLLQFEH